VRQVGDILKLSPRRHIDYSRTVAIGSILGFGRGDEVTLAGEIVELNEVRAGKPRVTAKLADGTGWVRITWFNTWVAKQIALGDRIAISGKPDEGFSTLSFTNPEWERSGGAALSTGRLVPVYPLTKGLAQKSVRGITRAALDATRSTIVEFLPLSLREERDLLDLGAAYEQAHYPDSYADLEQAQRRLAFDTLLLLQLGLLRRRAERVSATGIPLAPAVGALHNFTRGLPFRLTSAQERALREIVADLSRPAPMGRLLQGDVGSGKTAVAAAAAVIAVANAAQVAVMAPTEILAEQHYHNLRGLYAHLPEKEAPRVALLTGSTSAAARRELMPALASGDIDLLVGTHALIQPEVTFQRLALIVIDEQHRFGVRQRAELIAKARGPEPHVLAMSATPIPRTLNMVLNGDMDVSIIDELPPGRIPIDTRRYIGIDRSLAYDLVRQQVGAGRQVFVICPLIEESEITDAKAATAETERLRRDVFPDLRIATLHGRMSSREKDRVMTAFRDGESDILVSTSVIEVGIDVPNATVMLVEGADRFGLAQLHQFRGRVGRGGNRSYCLLLADQSSPDGEARLQLMTESNDGFVLAEKDLDLRGPGDFIGTRQSGLPEMAWVDGSFDTRLLDEARQTAEQIIGRDARLHAAEHQALRQQLERFWASAGTDAPWG
jgi:ATP-dependent DNA helicase RecG